MMDIDEMCLVDSREGKRQLTMKQKKIVFERQGGKCANNPHFPAIGLKDFLCPLWESPRLCGNFDKNICQFDHIDEFSSGGKTTIGNSQGLCSCCHSYKTRKFMSQSRKREIFTTREIDDGRAHMEDEKTVTQSKKRKIKSVALEPLVWDCPICTFTNTSQKKACEICGLCP